jgi:hypothetical protein
MGAAGGRFRSSSALLLTTYRACLRGGLARPNAQFSTSRQSQLATARRNGEAARLHICGITYTALRRAYHDQKARPTRWAAPSHARASLLELPINCTARPDCAVVRQ